jgi:hypothetical protein
VEGVKDGDRVGQPVTNGVRISPKWVQRSLLHAVDEPVGLGFQPGFIDAPGAADDGIQQPGVQASSLVTGQIHDDGDGPIDPDPRWPPNVLVHSKGLHPAQPIGVAGAGLGFDLDCVPGCVPIHTQMPGQRRDGGVVVTERAGCPRNRAGCQHRSGRRHIVGLAESRRRAQRFSTPPDPHQPSQQRDPGEARRIVQYPKPPAMANCHYPTCRACGLRLTRLDGEH